MNSKKELKCAYLPCMRPNVIVIQVISEANTEAITPIQWRKLPNTRVLLSDNRCWRTIVSRPDKLIIIPLTVFGQDASSRFMPNSSMKQTKKNPEFAPVTVAINIITAEWQATCQHESIWFPNPGMERGSLVRSIAYIEFYEQPVSRKPSIRVLSTPCSPMHPCRYAHSLSWFC